jgi:hypothetical protein
MEKTSTKFKKQSSLGTDVCLGRAAAANQVMDETGLWTKPRQPVVPPVKNPDNGPEQGRKGQDQFHLSATFCSYWPCPIKLLLQ